ncbi:flagellar motor protein MotB [Gammaproteobacteria bacterium AH-315-K14]|nr:flagellar motor protein MotB [Gammaproteobacteria bacterium AH-315-K14]
MENQTIIVKKIKKGGHGHHGGGWKVAFADFAVAMMAFFLLLWLIASTTKEEKAGLSEYFSPPTQGLAEGSGKSESLIDMGGGQKISQGDDSKDNAREPRALTERELIRAAEAENERLESLMEELKKSISASQALKPFKDQLLLDITPEGLRIQIVDKENRPMFDSGSAELKGYTKEILHELAKTINTVKNRISLTGHTDASQFVGRENYSNWELSADRANASRRELINGGLDAKKMAKVIGLASMVLFNKAEPRHPINRRIAIIVMNKAAEKALFSDVNPVYSAAEGENLLKEGVDHEHEGAIDLTPESESAEEDIQLEEHAKDEAGVEAEEHSHTSSAAPVEQVKAEPVVKAVAKPKTKPLSKAKEKPKSKPKPQRTIKRSPDKASRSTDLPPAQESGQSHINIPSPIAPINPIKIP